MRTTQLTLIIFLSINLSVKAQQPDYVIMQKGDTLYGVIENNDWYTLGKTVIFTNKNGITTKYQPSELKGFGIDSYEFEAIDHKKFSLLLFTSFPTRSFMLRRISGPSSLYVNFTQLTGYTPQDGYGLFAESGAIEYTDYYVTLPNNEMIKVYDPEEVENGELLIFTDCFYCINAAGDEGHGYMESLITTYNQWFSEGSSDFSTFANQEDQINIFLFKNIENQEDEDIKLNLKLNGKKLPQISNGEYLNIISKEVSDFYLKVKGKGVKLDLSFHAQKKYPILLELVVDDYFSEIRLIDPEKIGNDELANKKFKQVKY